jgi:hypothetical protein
MKGAIERCSVFSTGSIPLDLFAELKKAILDYVDAIGSAMPNQCKKNDFEVACVIINTSDYLSSIVDGLPARLLSRVGDDHKSQLQVEDVKTKLDDQRARQLRQLADLACAHSRPNLEAVCQNGPQILKNVPGLVALIRNWLSETPFNAFRTVFVPKWVDLYFASIFQCQKSVVSESIEQLSELTDSLKKHFLKQFIPVGANQIVTTIATNLIEGKFGQIKNGLKLVMSPEWSSDLYVASFTDGTFEQFVLLARCWGTEKTQDKLQSDYDAAVKQWNDREK